MNFKESLERYRAGTASLEEAAYIEAAIEKNKLIHDYLSDQMLAPFDANTGSDKEMIDTSKVKKASNRKLMRFGILSVCSLIVFGLLFQWVALPLYDRSFYNPNEGYKNNFGSMQLFADVSAYSELHFPGYIAANASAESLGLGRYDVQISLDHVMNRSPYTYTDQIIRDKMLKLFAVEPAPYANAFYNAGESSIVYQEGGDKTWSEQRPEEYQAYLSELTSLPATSYVSAYVSLKQDLTMEQFMNMQERYKDVFFAWIGIRSIEHSGLPSFFGLDPSGRGIVLEKGTVPEQTYPCFELSHCADDRTQPYTSDTLSTHFKSLLKYLSDRPEFLRAIQPNSNSPEQMYAERLAYVEEHGVNMYGALIVGHAANIADFAEQEQVNSLVIDDVKLSPYSR